MNNYSEEFKNKPKHIQDNILEAREMLKTAIQDRQKMMSDFGIMLLQDLVGLKKLDGYDEKIQKVIKKFDKKYGYE